MKNIIYETSLYSDLIRHPIFSKIVKGLRIRSIAGLEEDTLNRALDLFTCRKVKYLRSRQILIMQGICTLMGSRFSGRKLIIVNPGLASKIALSRVTKKSWLKDWSNVLWWNRYDDQVYFITTESFKTNQFKKNSNYFIQEYSLFENTAIGDWILTHLDNLIVEVAPLVVNVLEKFLLECQMIPEFEAVINYITYNYCYEKTFKLVYPINNLLAKRYIRLGYGKRDRKYLEYYSCFSGPNKDKFLKFKREWNLD